MSRRPQVLCTAPNVEGEDAAAILEELADVTYASGDRDKLLRTIDQFDAWWVHYHQKVDVEVLNRASRLKTINTCSTGTDHIDKDECAERGIRVLCIAKDISLLNSFTATAECAFMLLLSCFRNMRTINRLAHDGSWHNAGVLHEGRQLSGKTMGVLGVGRLGKMTVDYAKGFRMRVIGCDLLPIDVPGVEQVSFDDLLQQSDAISVHIHMTEENHHLFSKEIFARMRPGMVLINTSRGDVIDEQALIVAMEDGTVRAFGADVLHNEFRPTMADSVVVRYSESHDNVVLTPHIGGATLESVTDARLFSARKLAHYLRTGEELCMP